MLRTTIGQLVVNHGLPSDMQNYDRVLDKGGVKSLLRELATKHPDKYREVSHYLQNVARHTQQITGGTSFGSEHLLTPSSVKAFQRQLRNETQKIYTDPKLNDKEKEEKVVQLLSDRSDDLTALVLKESEDEGNPLALQVKSGARGNPLNLRSLRGGDLLYTDHRNRPIPIPILRSYSQGLTPAEYFAGTFGARRGVISTKFAVQKAGFYAKQLAQIGHRLTVAGLDYEKPPEQAIGLPVTVDDADNVGALLAKEVAGYPRNTILTPDILADLKKRGQQRILVRSPIVGGHPSGGVYARDVGVRENRGLPASGEAVGLIAGQSLSEPVTQGMLSEKHKGGVATGKQEVGGFELFNSLLQVPKTFRGGAAHAQVDGRVQSIRKATQGGHYVTIDNQDHYVGHGYEVLVKPGQSVEAGDVISEGIANPAEIVKHKGIGEGRRYFTQQMRKAYKDSNVYAHRRQVELLARGFINHVELTDEVGSHVPGDVVPYSAIEHSYTPRDGHKIAAPKSVLNHYLEKPVLHYSIGTRVTPSVLKELADFGVEAVAAHPAPPPWKPRLIRGLENIAHDQDWLTRFIGPYLERGFLRGVHRGDVSDEVGSSFVPSLSRAVNFGQTPLYTSKPSGRPLLPPPKPANSILSQMIGESPAIKAAADAGQLDELLDSLQPFREQDAIIDYAEPADLLDDGEEEESDYPVTRVEYPLGSKTSDRYLDEAGNPLEFFGGSDLDRGYYGVFKIVRRDSFKTKTKAFYGLTRKELHELFAAFRELLVGKPTFTRTADHFLELLDNHAAEIVA